MTHRHGARFTVGEASEVVRTVVRAVPPGTVLTYGDVAELAGLRSPRIVARVISRGLAGADIAWWRIVRADGTLPNHLQIEARRRYEAEATPLKDTRTHWVQVNMNRARWAAPPEFVSP